MISDTGMQVTFLQDIYQDAFMERSQVLNQDKSYPTIFRDGPEQLFEGFEPAWRSANTHYRVKINSKPFWVIMIHL